MRSIGCALLLFALTAAAIGQSRPSPVQEETARKLFEHGQQLSSRNQAAEALTDFMAVVTDYGSSSVADEALVAIARHHLEVSFDAAEAKKAVDLLMTRYRNSDSAPMGYVLQGRLKLMENPGAQTVDSAITDFERVKVFADNEALAAAVFYWAEALGRWGRPEDSARRYAELVADYPGSAWAARGSLGLARTLVRLDRYERAMAVLQRVSTWMPGSVVESRARAWNTQLYRLHVRRSAQLPLYVPADRFLAGPAGKIKEVCALAADRSDNIFAVYRNGVAVFGPNGKVQRTIAGRDLRGLFVGADGEPVMFGDSGICREGESPRAFIAPKADKTQGPIEEPPAAVMLSSRQVLLVDRGAPTVSRFTAGGAFLGVFARGRADRLAVNWRDDVAVLDRGTKSITVLDSEGTVVARVPPKGTDYELRNPVDVLYDVFGHMYVLERSGDRSGVFIFSTAGRLLARFNPPLDTEWEAREPDAFALDSAGRLYIYDGKRERVQVYR